MESLRRLALLQESTFKPSTETLNFLRNCATVEDLETLKTWESEKKAQNAAILEDVCE